MRTGRFLVTHAEPDSAVLRDVEDGQVLTLGDNPDLAEGEALEATVRPEPPLEVTWELVEIEDRWVPTVVRSEEPPTRQARTVAAEQAVGELTRRERAGEGEVHVLTVPEDDTDAAVADVIDDEATRSRAARLGVDRVEVRAEDGVLSVRYLP